ncbi:helix-turn-helix transcriptional regulator [Mesorhizobium sp. A623]
MSDLPDLRALWIGRMLSGLTQQQLADLAGVSRGAIWRIESGNERVTHGTVRKVQAALGRQKIDILKSTEQYRWLVGVRR